MVPCAHCHGSGWLDTVRSVARRALPAIAGATLGPAAGAAAQGLVSMSGLGQGDDMDGAGRMIKLADGRRVRKLFDRRGQPVEIHRPKRAAPSWLAERNAAVRRIMLEEGMSLAQASAELKARGWQRGQ